jgi:NitT/TauT family transport system substrate-binding protein
MSNPDTSLRDLAGRVAMKPEFPVSRRKAVGLLASIAATPFSRIARAQTGQLQRATLRLNYVPNAEHAPYYLGLKKGFYKDVGIDLQILPGTGSNDTVRLVGAGNDMFGVAVADAVVTGRGRGAPVVSLGVLLQQSPNVMVSLKKSGITKPTDLYGKKVGVPSRSTVYAFWLALIKAAGLDASKVETIDLGTTPTSGVLVGGGIDAAITLATNEKVALELRGIELNVIDLGQYGVRSYGQILFCNDTLAEKQPELVKNVTAATFKSWQYTIEHTKEAIEALKEYVPETNIDHELAKWKEITPRTKARGDQVPFGHQDAAGWRSTYETFAAAGLIGTAYDPTKLIAVVK